MDSRQTKKRPCSATQPTDKNAKRRELYGNIAMAEKEALLLQRRLQQRNTTTERLVLGNNNANPNEPSEVDCNIAVGISSISKEVAATTTTSDSIVIHRGKNVLHPTSVSKKATALCGVSRQSPAIHKEQIVTNRFYNFEKGSTSASAANPQPKASDVVTTVGSSSSAEPWAAAIEVMLQRKVKQLSFRKLGYLFVYFSDSLLGSIKWKKMHLQ